MNHSQSQQTIPVLIAIHEPATGEPENCYHYGASIGSHDIKRESIDRSGTRGVLPCYITPDEEAALLSRTIKPSQVEAICKDILIRYGHIMR